MTSTLKKQIVLSSYFDEKRNKKLIKMDTNYNLYVCKFIFYYELIYGIRNNRNFNNEINSFSSMENGPVPREFYKYRSQFLKEHNNDNKSLTLENKKYYNEFSSIIDFDIAKLTLNFIEANSNLDNELIAIGHSLDFWKKTTFDNYYLNEICFMNEKNISQSDLDTIEIALELFEEYPNKEFIDDYVCFLSKEAKEKLKEDNSLDLKDIPNELKECSAVYIGFSEGVFTYE